MADIQFTVRKRTRVKEEFWSVEYDGAGTIKKISAGRQPDNPKALNVTYAKIKSLLEGSDSQSNYKVALNEKIGALDLVDKRKLDSYKLATNSRYNWHSTTLHEENNNAEIKFVLFAEKGIVRVEPNRIWTTRAMENKATMPLKIYITDSSDPHIYFGNIDIAIGQLMEKGYAEFSLWDLIDPSVIHDIVHNDKDVRLNLPQVATGIVFVKTEKYYAFNGTSELQTIISHPGPGTHITLYIKDGKVYAQSNYTAGSAIDDLTGDLKGALITGDDPDNFVAWVSLPALMLRQNVPFEISTNWPNNTPINLLYKANNLDVGVEA